MTPLLPRRLIRLAARLLVGALVFAQVCVAAIACAPLERSAAFAATVQERESACHEPSQPDAGACLTHCSSADQSLGTPQIVVAAMPAVALLTVPPRIDADSMIWSVASPGFGSGGPPIPIRFQVFRI